MKNAVSRIVPGREEGNEPEERESDESSLMDDCHALVRRVSQKPNKDQDDPAN